jgi:ribosomal protein S12 methylthiotransferase
MVGRSMPVIIDEIGDPDEDNSIGATGRSQADAPEAPPAPALALRNAAIRSLSRLLSPDDDIYAYT